MGNKLEQLQHPGLPNHPMYLQNIKTMNSAGGQVSRSSFILSQQQKMADLQMQGQILSEQTVAVEETEENRQLIQTQQQRQILL